MFLNISREIEEETVILICKVTSEPALYPSECIYLINLGS